MTLERYEFYTKRIKKDFAKEYKQAKLDLKTSKSKRKDYRILFNFFENLCENCDIDVYAEMLTDCNAMMPMPQSVSKQIATMLFKPKYLNPLMDMDIWEGFY